MQLDQGIVRIAQEVATNAARNAIMKSPEISALKEGQYRLEGSHNRLEKKVNELQKDVAGLKEGQKRLEKDVGGLKEGQKRLEKDVAGLKTGLQKNTDLLEKNTNALVQVLDHIKAQSAPAQEP